MCVCVLKGGNMKGLMTILGGKCVLYTELSQATDVEGTRPGHKTYETRKRGRRKEREGRREGE